VVTTGREGALEEPLRTIEAAHLAYMRVGIDYEIGLKLINLARGITKAEVWVFSYLPASTLQSFSNPTRRLIPFSTSSEI